MRRSRIAVAGAFVVAMIIGLSGRWRRYEIRESSMEPQLAAGDYIIAAVRDQPLQRGDIVILRHPEITGFDLIKRVIGLPGETVGLSNGYVHINGIVLAEPWASGPSRPDGEWTLGPNEVFVLGDSRRVSAADSRTIGPVDDSTIRWQAVARYWPLRSAGRIVTKPFSR